MGNPKRWLHRSARVLAIGGLALFFGGGVAAAPPHLSGTYRCVSAEVDGKVRPCTVPSIEMNSDGSYQMLMEHGTYEILQGHWLVLSAAKNHGRARLDGNNRQIIFEFLSNGKKNRIVYRRKYQRPPAWVSG